MADTTETSVFLSLRELVSLEDQRVAEEQEERALRERRAEEVRQREEAERKAAAAARRQAEAEARAEERRRASEEAARLRAIEHAAVERARLEVEATAARELLAAQNAHERALVAARQSHRLVKLRRALALGVTLVVMGGGAAAVLVERHLAAEQAAHEARIAALAAERQRLFGEGLASLDRLHRQLDERLSRRDAVADELSAAAARARAIRDALRPEALDPRGLDAFEAALDALGSELSRQDGRDRLRRLDGLHGELRSIFERVKRPDEGLAKAAARAETTRRGIDASAPQPDALAAFEEVLEVLTVALTKAVASGPRGPLQHGPLPREKVAPPPTEEHCNWHDPMSFCLERK